MVVTSKTWSTQSTGKRGNLETSVKISNCPLLLAVVLQRLSNTGVFTQSCFPFTYLCGGESLK